MKVWEFQDKIFDEINNAESKMEEAAFISYKLEKGSDIERKYMHIAKLIQGLFTNYGQHAAGVIISKDTISDNLPLMYNEKRHSFETQCNMAQAEEKGYLKMDFLALKNLSIITDVMQMTKDGRICDLEQREQILQDKRIYEEIYAKGLTHGVFQAEGEGIKNIFMGFSPECFEDVILIIAAYRPGPMQYIPEIIAEKWYRKDPKKYPKPTHSIQIENTALKRILEPTYGCIIYQEQIMQICRELASFSMAEADNVRRYMSKKKYEALEKKRGAFIEGCKANGLTTAEAVDLFEQMKEFAKYAFNKSHAVAYSLISVITAYEKLYHPVEFFTSSLNHIESLDEISGFIAEFANFGVALKGPDILSSSPNFTCDNTTIYYGLNYIKGLSELSLKKTDDYLSFLLENKKVLSMKILEKLIKCGLFDSMEPDITRMDLIRITKTIFKRSSEYFKEQTKIEALQDTIAFLEEYRKKARLTTKEKQDIKNRLNSKRSIDKLTPKAVEGLIEAKTTELAKKHAELNQLMDDLQSILRRERVSSRHTSRSTLINRKNEQELLGYVFDTFDSLNRIESGNALPKRRGLIDTDIPKLGLVVLNPCVRITKCGWTKMLCMDKNRTQKAFYFKEPLPSDTTEFFLNFKKEEENFIDSGKAHFINVWPHAYTLKDVAYAPTKHIFMRDRETYTSFAKTQLNGQKGAHTAYLYYNEDEIGIPCHYEECIAYLKARNVEYVEWAA